MIKKKATKKVSKNVKSNSYTYVSNNIYRTAAGTYRARKMIDGVLYCSYTDTIKQAKDFLKNL
jgi:hypothetical protein